MTSLAPYLVTKYFPLLLLFQPRRDFPRCCQPGMGYLKFSRSLGGEGGAGKQFLPPLP